MSLTNDTNEAKLYWVPGATTYPASLTLGTLPSIIASVSFSPGTGTDQPYYMFAFTDPGDSFLDTTTGHQILLIEFQPAALSGPGDDTLAFDPATTLFNLYDNTSGTYLEAPGGIPGPAGQQHTNSLDGWIAQDPSLGSDDVQQIEIAMGLAGGPGTGESLTVYSADVTETATPEPSSLLLLGTGLLGLAFVAFRRAKASGLKLGL
jgi:hypothetical protein